MHDKELLTLHPSSENQVMRPWGDEKCVHNFWLESLKVREYLEYVGVDGAIILQLIMGKRVRGCGLGSSGSAGYDLFLTL